MRALLGALAEVPVLAQLGADAESVGRQGIHGSVALGPVGLSVASATLVIHPPALTDGTGQPVSIGPFQIGEIAASLTPPFGGGSGKGLPGGGAIVRLAGQGGYGGILQLPLGPAQVSAAAVLAMRDGSPSFLAILGITFIPPIQLSFGFSLDRVGGIVGLDRTTNTEALRAAVRTGSAGDVLFAARPPDSPLALVTAADRLFPAHHGTHLVGPSLKVSWLSFGPTGSLLSLDLAVVVEIPTGRVVILGVARASIPGLPGVLELRLDLLGVIDPVEALVSVDASLVDSHALGIFEVYGDAAMRFSWGTRGYTVVSVGGFYPGYNPEPAKLPALRRVGMALDVKLPILDVRAEGYFAITSNSVQFGGRLEIGISLGLEAHGFVQVDAIVVFRPFRFEARVSAGFDVSAGGFSFGGVRLDGLISGPGPVVIRGSLTIETFLFDISWDETFTLGSGPADTLPTPPSLLDVIREELGDPANTHADSVSDPDVVLAPRPGRAGVAAVPPTGTLRFEQRRAPLGLLVERVDGRLLAGPQGVRVTTPGADVTAPFSPGSYAALTDAEALNRPPYDVLTAGRVLSMADPGLVTFPNVPDARTVTQIVISSGRPRVTGMGAFLDVGHMALLTDASRRPPTLSDPRPVVTAERETWVAWTTATTHGFDSATAAHQFARHHGTVAVTEADFETPVSMAGVL
ncbi:hypothetical protein N801_19035 [Knoellia aerolata DSM 18566]|uniref:DUF6603 domain-containing protein n=1 Tax=Knoellia aerolata DSM 18566 TaxID=1385519 RepID=A0A0A0JRE5_9MICO|nr:hypothetical protein N801_19035 [Knoellia aerolata DSM 18566]